MSLATLSGVGGGGKDLTLFRKLVDGSITEVTAEDLDGVTTIKPYTFLSRTHITSVTIPDSVTSIGEAAFSWCTGILDMIVGSGVENIGNAAFNRTQSLKKIVFCSANPPVLVTSSILTNTGSNLIIYIPLNSISLYAGATNWSALLTTYSYAPLVSTIADLSNIDTATYVKACVVGADESYKEYTYDGSQWNEVV